MKKIQLITILIILPLMLHALPKEILADKYLLGAKTSIDKQDYQSANGYFQKIIDLDIALPDDFYFQYGKNALILKEYDKALKYVNLYLEKAGSSGKYYRDALLMSNEAEEGLEQLKHKEETGEHYQSVEDKKIIEAVIPEYTLTILPTPSNAKIIIKHIKDTYSDGMRLKEGTYSFKISKKGYKSKEITINLNKDINRSVKLTKIKKKVKKPVTVYHCTAKSDRASGWVERVGLQNAKNGALHQCNIRRQTNSYCYITSCYKVR